MGGRDVIPVLHILVRLERLVKVLARNKKRIQLSKLVRSVLEEFETRIRAGIQKSLTPNWSISDRPADFTTPEDNMKLVHRPAPRISLVLRPSR